MGNPSLVTAYGPGLSPDSVIINKPTYFDISAKGKLARYNIGFVNILYMIAIIKMNYISVQFLCRDTEVF